MKCVLALVLLGVVAVSAVPGKRTKREAYQLPDGAELLLGGYSTNFVCQQDGYYADVDNNCQIFHICNTDQTEAGPQVNQYSFMCGNQTVFSQLTFTCNHPDEAIPCGSSQDFYRLNSNLGNEKAPFLEEQDVLQGENLKQQAGPGSNRIAPAGQPPRRSAGSSSSFRG